MYINLSDTAFGGPFSVRVTVGESAVFTTNNVFTKKLTVPCINAITWFATKHLHAVRQSVSTLTNHTKSVSQCTSDDVYTEVLLITATVDINSTLLQCAAINFDVCGNASECKLTPKVCFSRFAELTSNYDMLHLSIILHHVN